MSERKGNPLGRVLRSIFQRSGSLDEGLQEMDSQLGLTDSRLQTIRERDETVKTPTRDLARSVIYAPDMDGQADSGEVVWVNIRIHKSGELERRAVVIVGRNRNHLMGLLISSNTDHANEDNWLRIGHGPWNYDADENWVRLDKVLQFPEASIQRRGVSMPERRYERIATQLRKRFGWH
ncbi:type II toxin-antitoxin system PemK/MazF family toxin [Corynebacterium auriscanis]|uniref:type II toxin-antitoxin system PemK/MazF family toxin n=1 Tax=Corynebacterium auriscanis TaxID=99807 RepID=UPI0024ADD66A|nr:type II toxin-antitoxin system PemK/MazF family toxin [Corynebacterium auriscanis]